MIKSNLKNSTSNPPISIKTYKDIKYAKEVNINGPSKLVYKPAKPLGCGATLWLETDSEYVDIVA